MVANKSEVTGKKPVNRRNFIKGGAAIASGLAVAAVPTIAMPADPENLPPHVPSWSHGLGDGVDVSPYGMPFRV
jgi:sulfane dehydrogenase subunit SoxC